MALLKPAARAISSSSAAWLSCSLVLGIDGLADVLHDLGGFTQFAGVADNGLHAAVWMQWNCCRPLQRIRTVPPPAGRWPVYASQQLGSRPGIGGFGRLELFHLSNLQGTGGSLAMQRFGQQLPVLEHTLCLTGFRVMRRQAQGAAVISAAFVPLPERW